MFYDLAEPKKFVEDIDQILHKDLKLVCSNKLFNFNVKI